MKFVWDIPFVLVFKISVAMDVYCMANYFFILFFFLQFGSNLIRLGWDGLNKYVFEHFNTEPYYRSVKKKFNKIEVKNNNVIIKYVHIIIR